MKIGGSTSQSAARDQARAVEGLPIGESQLFRHVLAMADAVATNDAVVLLEGESGTGKELIAHRIHSHSRRYDAPFIPVNCAGISDSLFESQFFGHVRGAFTGAFNETLGVVRAAEGGTLLLDEVGEIPLHLQPKLLRLLQQHEIIPVGGAKPINVDVRFIAATNCDLRRQVEKALFRPDLYHRLNIVRIEIPPLRCRVEDVEPLLDAYLDIYAHEYNMTRRVLGPTIRQQLKSYAWPGNVRELCAYVERLYAADLPPLPPSIIFWDMASDGHADPPKDPDPGRMTHLQGHKEICSLARAEQHAILRALEYANWNRSAAAKILDIHRSTLLRKMRFFGLE